MILFQYHQVLSTTILVVNPCLVTVWDDSLAFHQNCFSFLLLCVLHFSSSVTIRFKIGLSLFRFGSVLQALLRFRGLCEPSHAAPKHRALLVSGFLQTIFNASVANAHLMVCIKRFHLPVKLDVFHDLFVIRDHSSSARCLTYHIVFTCIELSKPFLRGQN